MTGYKILLVDDDPAQHNLLDSYMGLAGFQILHAENGDEALKVLDAEMPDIVLLDIQMPVMDGFQTLEKIRKRPAVKNISVIFLTGLDKRHLKIKGLEAGADDYITKPFNSAELLARIKAVLRRTERYRRTEGIMDGNLADIGLVELMQSMEVGYKTAVIHLEKMKGAIFIENGMLVYARQDTFTGDQALYRLFFLEKGSYTIDFEELPASIPKAPASIMNVLMRVLAYVDEIKDTLQRIKGKTLPLQFISDLTEFPEIDKIRKLPEQTFIDLMLLMKGDLKDNIDILIAAAQKKKFKVLK